MNFLLLYIIFYSILFVFIYYYIIFVDIFKIMKTKRERFETVAANRVQKIINGFDSLAKCSNKNNYEYNNEDVKKMMIVIKKKVKEVEETFNLKLNKSSNEFKF